MARHLDRAEPLRAAWSARRARRARAPSASRSPAPARARGATRAARPGDPRRVRCGRRSGLRRGRPLSRAPPTRARARPRRRPRVALEQRARRGPVEPRRQPRGEPGLEQDPAGAERRGAGDAALGEGGAPGAGARARNRAAARRRLAARRATRTARRRTLASSVPGVFGSGLTPCRARKASHSLRRAGPASASEKPAIGSLRRGHEAAATTVSRLSLREPDAPLALVAAERVEVHLGVRGQRRGPRRVHRALRRRSSGAGPRGARWRGSPRARAGGATPRWTPP